MGINYCFLRLFVMIPSLSFNALIKKINPSIAKVICIAIVLLYYNLPFSKGAMDCLVFL